MDDCDKTKEQLRESESRYRLLAENVTDLIWTMDMNLRFTYMSPSVSRMLGFTPVEFMDRGLDEILTPESLERVNTIIEEELERESSDAQADPDRSRVVETDLLDKTGAMVPAETKASFLRDEDGRPVGILGVTRDITDRRKTEEQVGHLAMIAEQSAEGMAVVDLDGVLKFVNAAWAKMHGYQSGNELVGKRLNVFHTDEQMKTDVEPFNELVKRDGHHAGEVGHVRKDGSVFQSEMAANLFKDSSGRSIGLNAVMTDITERKRAEADLRESKELLSSVLQNSPDFIANIKRDRKLLFLNRTCNLKMDELRGVDVSSFLPPDVLDVISQGIESVFQTGRPVSLETSTPASDDTLHFELRMSPVMDEGKVVSVIANGTDITERKRIEETIKLRLEFEKTISNISSRLVISDIDSAINRSLEDMGGLSGASRAYLFLFSEDGTAMSNTHEWCAEGVASQIKNLQHLPVDLFPWWMERLRNGEVIRVKDVSKMPAEAEAEKKILQDQDIKSLLVFPTNIGGKLEGFLGLDEVVEARRWRDEDLRVLQMSADIIGNVIFRQRVEEALRAARDGLERRVRERTSDLEEAVRALRKSEASLAEAQRIARMGNWDWNVLTDEMTWSDEVCQLFDTTPGQLGSNYDEFLKSVHPEDREAVKKAAGLALREGRPYDIDHRIILPDGTERVVHQRGEVSPDNTGRPARMFGIIHDITERKHLEEDRARLAAATESSADGIVITDLDGTILYVNPAFERISGFSREECVGRDVQVCSGSENEQQFRREIWEALSKDGIWRGCLDRTKKDGSPYREERTITAVRHGSGEVINFAHIVRDVTEKLRLESIAQAVNTMSNTGYIFSGIRHEIGNPINSVGAVLKILKSSIDKYDKQAIHTYINRALNEISSVEVLLNNLKSFNMYESLELSDVNLSVFLDKFLTLVKTDSEKKGVAIAASVASDVELCRADPRALQQVLMNVLTNALDACGRRENPGISIDVSRQRGMIQIEVSDNGCGMSTAQQENLFKPFYTGKPHGTGLGLAITRKMLAMMNASIEVISEKDVGTTANIQLPEAQSES